MKDGMVIGLDLSLAATGICYWEPREVITATVHGRHAGWERLVYLREQLAERLSVLRTRAVVVEDIAFASTSPGHAEICALHWDVREILGRCGHELLLVPASTLKVFATGYGHAKKPSIVTAAETVFRVPVRDDNQADAVILAFMGAARLGLWKCTNARQERCLAEWIAAPERKAARKAKAKAKAKQTRARKQGRLVSGLLFDERGSYRGKGGIL